MRVLLTPLAAMAVALPSLALAASADGGGREHSDEPQFSSGIPEEVAARAGISAEQEREIARLTAEANAELDELRTKHRSAKQALERLLKDPNSSEDAVLAQLERVGAAETEIRKNRVALMLQIRRVLGPEKWASLQRELEMDRQVAQQHPADTAPQNARDDAQVPRVGEPVQTEQVGGTLRTSPP